MLVKKEPKEIIINNKNEKNKNNFYKIKRNKIVINFYLIIMGCTYTEGDFTPQLSEDL
jgi:hypothetical protein